MKHYISKRVVCVCLILSLLILSSIPSEAYSLVGAKVRIMQGLSSSMVFIPHEDFGDTTILHFNHACYPWNEASGYGIVSRSVTQRHSKTAFPRQDAMNGIYRVAVSDDYVAYTYRYVSHSIITEADINLNMNWGWANSAQPNCFDVWSVFMHEVGHAIGIGHSTKTDAVMYKYVYKNYTRRDLTSDDRNAVYANYHS